MAEGIQLAVEALGGPMHFISGNHEDFDWLAGLHRAADAVDPLGAFRHVADGAVFELGDQKVAFLGGVDAPVLPFDLNSAAYEQWAHCVPYRQPARPAQARQVEWRVDQARAMRRLGLGRHRGHACTNA